MNREATFETYRKLCSEGGSKPFSQLVADAGLVSPFEEDALAEVVHEAEQELGI